MMGLLVLFFLVLLTRCSAKCNGSIAVEPFSKHGINFDAAYCKLFGSLLLDYDDSEKIYLEEEGRFCSCVSEAECKSDTVYTKLASNAEKQCPEEKVCCLHDIDDDDDELECPQREPKSINSSYNDLKCAHSAAGNATFVVAVLDKKENVRCGGVIIHERIVVTDSDCLSNNESPAIKRVKTAYEINIGSEKKRISIPIKEYKTKDFVALLLLKKSFNFSLENFKPACLPKQSQHQDEQDFSDDDVFEICADCVVYTWPLTQTLSVVENTTVRKNNIALKTRDYCLKQLGTHDEKKYENITTICAGFESSDKCKIIGLGKSGMPALCQLQNGSKGHLALAGITTTFARCGTNHSVAFFARLPFDWIYKQAKDWGYLL